MEPVTGTQVPTGSQSDGQNHKDKWYLNPAHGSRYTSRSGEDRWECAYCPATRAARVIYYIQAHLREHGMANSIVADVFPESPRNNNYMPETTGGSDPDNIIDLTADGSFVRVETPENNYMTETATGSRLGDIIDLTADVVPILVQSSGHNNRTTEITAGVCLDKAIKITADVVHIGLQGKPEFQGDWGLLSQGIALDFPELWQLTEDPTRDDLHRIIVRDTMQHLSAALDSLVFSDDPMCARIHGVIEKAYQELGGHTGTDTVMHF